MRDHSHKRANISSQKLLVAGLAAFVAARKLYKVLTKTDIAHKVVIVTGGSRGLGLAIAIELAKKKARIVLVARNNAQLVKAKQIMAPLSNKVLTIQADVTNPDEVKGLMKRTYDHFGRIDILINNAGIMSVGPENVMEIKDFKAIMDSNLWSALYTIREAIPYFKRQGVGHIVNICSIGGKIAVPHMTPYSVSKFALVGLSQGLSSELAKENIKVMTVVPNLMRTGSPRNITVKGNHEAEYAWFKLADSLPFLSQSAKGAARRIVSGIEHNDTEVTLTFSAKIITALHATFPGFFVMILGLVNRLLPQSEDRGTKKGHESESAASENLLTKITDKAAIKYNQY